MKLLTHIPLCLGLACLLQSSYAGISITGSTVYTQNFDTLPSSAHHTEFSWTDDVTIPGIYLHRSNAPAAPAANLAGTLATAAERPYTSDGSDVATTAPNYHGFLSLGTNLDADRALGFCPTTTDSATNWAGGTLSIVAIFTNNSTKTVDLTTLAYDIEARRGNSAAANAETISLTSKTGTAAALLTELGTRTATATFSQTGWATVPATGAITNFDYQSTTGFTTPAPPSSVPRSGTLTTPIRLVPGQSVALRWGNDNDTGTDAQLGIDNLSVTFAEVTTPSLSTSVGATTLNHHGTVSTTDDTVDSAVTVLATSLGASTGWTSDLLAPDGPQSGLYATANPVPFHVAAASVPKSVILSNASPAATATFTIPKPAATLTASVVAGSIVRNVNGPGDEDDTVSFNANIASTNAGPSCNLACSLLNQPGLATLAPTTATYGSGPYAFTLTNVPNSAANVLVTIADASYPILPAPVTITIAVPAPATASPQVVGTKTWGAISRVVAATTAPEWINYPGSKELLMTTGIATDSVVETEVLDLSSVGAVSFSAKLTARENSVGSNFEATDKWKAELIIDGVVTSILGAYDTGDGAASAAGAPNGPADGYLNGFQGVAVTGPPAVTALQDYDNNRIRDEFDISGQPGIEFLNNTLTFTHTIPATANSVSLKIYGRGVTGSEAFIVKEVSFTGSLGPVDTDGDGMTDDYETANNLNPAVNDAALDFDHDGQTNLQEFLAGTQANNPASGLVLNATTHMNSTTGSYSISWSSVVGKTYHIEASTNLEAPSWTAVGAPVIATGTTTTISGTFPFPAPDRIFIHVKTP